MKCPNFKFLTILTVCCFLIVSSGYSGLNNNTENDGSESGKIRDEQLFSRRFGQEIADAVEMAMPSVVVVRTEAIHYFIAQDIFEMYPYHIPRRLAGQGSGVIINPEGYILTCNHVVKDAQEIEVVLHDGTPYPAKLIGCDAVSDLAVLKIDSDECFTPIQTANSDDVRVGEFAVAIGSPFSLSSSVTVGIISQKGRTVGLLPYEDFIQTDAPINPGNSGGPLIDVEGKMVGINSAIQTPSPYSRGNVGIAFAIPSNLAMDVANSIIEKGYYKRPRIGITIGQMNPTEAEKTLGRKFGVYVDTVLNDSPAYEAGIQAGDIIKEVDGDEVQTVKDVQRAIIMHKIGDNVKLIVVRDSKEIPMIVRTDEWTESYEKM